MTDPATTALAETWASIDGKLTVFAAEKERGIRAGDAEYQGVYDGYMAEARVFLERLRDRGFDVVPTQPDPIEMACAGAAPAEPEELITLEWIASGWVVFLTMAIVVFIFAALWTAS